MSLETEYQAINTWRNSKVQQHDIVSSIILPLAAWVFFSSFSELPPFQKLSWAGYFFTNFVIFAWRVWGRQQALTIIRRYPRIIDLEEHLGYKFTRQYLKEEWWPDHGTQFLPTADDVAKKIQEYDNLCWCKKWFTVDYYRRFKGQGREWWDILALAFIIITTIVMIF